MTNDDKVSLAAQENAVRRLMEGADEQGMLVLSVLIYGVENIQDGLDEKEPVAQACAERLKKIGEDIAGGTVTRVCSGCDTPFKAVSDVDAFAIIAARNPDPEQPVHSVTGTLCKTCGHLPMEQLTPMLIGALTGVLTHAQISDKATNPAPSRLQ